MPLRARRTEDLATALLQQIRPRAKSLIITVYGDAIVPHGGSTWLGDLIGLLGDFDMTERIVRTSVFRLAKDDWLTNIQIGRRSFYKVTEGGHERFAEAERHIYASPSREWDGGWHILMLSPAALDSEKREELRQELTWLGFGSAAAAVYMHPTCDEAAVHRRLAALGMTDKVVLMTAAQSPADGTGALREMVRSCWDIARLEHDYAGYLARFRPIWQAVEGVEVAPRTAFLLRTLMIHDFRRILLRDPLLPPELLPPDWHGQEARVLTRNLYRLLLGPSEAHLTGALGTANGPMPEPSPSFYSRFGGLSAADAAPKRIEGVQPVA
jgi:phenylacetic acid degradation operon negative regulatory protein